MTEDQRRIEKQKFRVRDNQKAGDKRAKQYKSQQSLKAKMPKDDVGRIQPTC